MPARKTPVTEQELDLAINKIRQTSNCRIRDIALLLVLFSTAAKPLEIARLEVRDYLNEDGSIREESTMRPEAAIGGAARPLFFASAKANAAIDAYLRERTRHRQGVHPSRKYRGLDPMSKLFLTDEGNAMPIKIKEWGKQRHHLCTVRHPEFADLRYDVRLFVPDPDAPVTGEALAELLAPDSGANGKEADAFSTPTESHLHPKLRLAIRSQEEFRKTPENHAAHLSFLFDVFPAEEIRAVDAQESDDSSLVHGLVQAFAVEYREDEQSITWLRRPLHGVALPLVGAEELTDLLGTMSRLFSVAAASISRGQSLPNARPVVALSLSADERAMLHQVHLSLVANLRKDGWRPCDPVILDAVSILLPAARQSAALFGSSTTALFFPHQFHNVQYPAALEFAPQRLPVSRLPALALPAWQPTAQIRMSDVVYAAIWFLQFAMHLAHLLKRMLPPGC
jgi:hypothetical protein